MRRWLAPLWVLGLLLAPTAGAAAGSVTVEVSTASGVRLGRLVGEPQAGVTYYLLSDVARLANATVRRSPRGDRMSLVSRRGLVEVARDARRVTIDGRAMTLAAPVRVRQGTWRCQRSPPARAPHPHRDGRAGDARRGARRLGGARPARGAPGGSGAARRRRRARRGRAPIQESAPVLPSPPASSTAPAAPTRPGEVARAEPDPPPAPPRPVTAAATRVELRVRSYPPIRAWSSRRTRRSSRGSSRPRRG